MCWCVGEGVVEWIDGSVGCVGDDDGWGVYGEVFLCFVGMICFLCVLCECGKFVDKS